MYTTNSQTEKDTEGKITKMIHLRMCQLHLRIT